MAPKSNVSVPPLATKRGVWQETGYSLLPLSESSLSYQDEDTAMTIKDKLIALKGRGAQEESSRIPSPELQMNGAHVDIDDTTVYRVYKKRWLGVGIIMLLNIVSSWRYFGCF
jgi:hypothetical protein